MNTKSKIIDEAYVLFTSGSTGIPKGISISRINLYNYLNNIKNVVKVSSTDNLTHLFELSFDLSIHDIYITLLNGATLCIPTKSDLLLPVNYISRNQISIWFSVPSFIANMEKLGILKKEKFSDIHTSLFCGEPLTILNAQLWQSACPNSKVINLYGPTEATIATTFFEYTNIDKNNSKALRGYVPIGNPFGGNRCYLKNLNDEEILQNNDNNEGELILFGDQLCKGYLNNKKKTNENFIKRKLKFDSYEKEFYLTGDIVRYTNKFGFIFLSRKDNQIKLNGHRIELGEVEYRIREITESSMVACIIKKVNGVERLICYWQNQGKKIDKLNIFEYLKKYLPAYMIPFEILNINTMPLNTNSKIDRKTLEAL